MTTATDTKFKHQWGLVPTVGVRFAWGARAIYQQGTIDLLWDRHAIDGESTEDERKALCRWLDDKALPWMCAQAAHDPDFPRGDEDREVVVRGDGYELRGNPRASYGYLYLSASVCPSATEPTPKPAKRRGRSR